MDYTRLSGEPKNESGVLFGQVCFPESDSCYWGLATNLKCDPGASYPVLVNTDAGATAMSLLCFKGGGGSGFYVFADFDAVSTAIANGQRIGIAFPMQSGQFLVSRFSLNGWVEAVKYMRMVIDLKLKSDTRDQLL